MVEIFQNAYLNNFKWFQKNILELVFGPKADINGRGVCSTFERAAWQCPPAGEVAKSSRVYGDIHHLIQF